MLFYKFLFGKCCSSDKDQFNQDNNQTIHVLEKPRSKIEPKPKPGFDMNNTNGYLLPEPWNNTSLNAPKYQISSFISDTDGRNSHSLRLKILESNHFPIGTTFPTNSTATTNLAFRNNDEDIMFVGSQELTSKTEETQMNFSSDIHIEGDPAIGSKHCAIKYYRDKKSYFIRDLGTGSGTFVKITSKIPIKNGIIINFADTYMIITFPGWPRIENKVAGDNKASTQISIKILDGPKKDEVFDFNSDVNLIKIGRMQDCQIIFKDSQLSRYQCNIEKIGSTWYIEDGYDKKSSTNGTWIFPTDYIEISNGSILRIGKNIFVVAIEKPSS